MAYVMFGRTVRLEDLYVAGDIKIEDIRCDEASLEESERLERIFEQSKQAEKDKVANYWKISYLNIQSFYAHHLNLATDNAINDADIIGLGETWLHKEQEVEVEGYFGHFANFGRGKGAAALTKMNLIDEPLMIASDKFSALLLKTKEFHVVFLYLSKNYPKEELFCLMNEWLKSEVPTVVMGDVNENFLDRSNFGKFMEAKEFSQLIQEPTYIDGTLIDHVYVNKAMKQKDIFAKIDACYYSSHDIISFYVKK